MKKLIIKLLLKKKKKRQLTNPGLNLIFFNIQFVFNSRYFVDHIAWDSKIQSLFKPFFLSCFCIFFSFFFDIWILCSKISLTFFFQIAVFLFLLVSFFLRRFSIFAVSIIFIFHVIIYQSEMSREVPSGCMRMILKFRCHG